MINIKSLSFKLKTVKLPFLLLAILLFSTQIPTLQAISSDKAEMIINNRPFYNKTPTQPCTSTTVGVGDTTTTPPTNTTDDQKIARTFMIGFSAGTDKTVIENVVKKFHIGGIVVLGTKDAAGAGFTKDFFAKLNQDAGFNLITGSDEEGIFSRYKYPFDFPSALKMSTMSDSAVEDIGKKVGQTLASNGINTDLAPVLDVAPDSSGTDAGTAGRAFSDNPDVVAQKAGAFAKGLRESGVNPVYKHFPGLGSAAGNSDTQAVTTASLTQLKAKDLKPYEKLLSQNGAGVMFNNASVPGLTAAGEVAGTSSATVSLLKTDYKFNGLTMTDDLVAKGVGAPLPQAIVKALQAGVDMPLFSYTNDDDIQAAIDGAKAANVNVAGASTAITAFSGTTTGLPQNAQTACCSSGSSTTLTGSDNGEKIWNFLISKGLTNAQVAGIMGNLQAEDSTFSPTDVNPSSGAYGIAQWLGGRLKALEALASSRGVDKSDFATQLDYLWSELTGPYKNSTLDPLKAATDLSSIVNIVLLYYEAPCKAGESTCVTQLALRLGYAQAWLNRSGGGAGSDTSTTSTNVSSVASGCTPSSSDPTTPPGGIPSGTAQELAKQILANPKITFTVALAKAAIQDTADGKPAKIEARCNAGDSVSLDPILLGMILKIAATHTVGIGYITNGCHTGGSRHYAGKAIDLGQIDGKRVTGDSSDTTFMQELMNELPSGSELGQDACGNTVNSVPGVKFFDDTCNHIHFGVPR